MKKGKSRADKKEKNKMITVKKERFITTTDNWYPNYDGDKVKLFILSQKFPHPDNVSKNFVRIAVWGSDDFGLQLDFIGDNDAENDAKFLEWEKTIFDNVPEPCSQDFFLQLGFTQA